MIIGIIIKKKVVSVTTVNEKSCACSIQKQFDIYCTDFWCENIDRSNVNLTIFLQLNWDEQFKRTKGKMRRELAALKKLNKVFPQSQMWNIYYGLIESNLRYDDAIWGSLFKKKVAAPQRLQDWVCSIISNARIRDNWLASRLNVENLFCYDRTVMT